MNRIRPITVAKTILEAHFKYRVNVGVADVKLRHAYWSEGLEEAREYFNSLSGKRQGRVNPVIGAAIVSGFGPDGTVL